MNKFVILLMTMIVLSMSSCGGEDPQGIERKNLSKRSLKDYQFWGEAHNAFLDDAIEHYSTEDSRVIGDEDAKPNISYEELNRQQIAYANSLDMDAALKPILCQGLQEMSPYYDSDLFYDEYFAKKNGQRKILTLIKNMRTNGNIDAFEYEVMYNIASNVASYKEGVINLQFLENLIRQYAAQWDQKYLFAPEDQGQAAAYVLVIAQASVEWWNENDLNTRAIPAWVAADAGGAIVGTVLEGASQYIKGGKITSWKTVGCKALSGAVVTSTGIAGRIGKWLFRL